MIMHRLELPDGMRIECNANSGALVEEANGVRLYRLDAAGRRMGWEFYPWSAIACWSRYRYYPRRPRTRA